MPPEIDADHRARLMWEEAKRLLERQEASLNDLRSRAVAILGVGSIVSSVFGGLLFPQHHHSLRVLIAGWMAVGFLGVTAILAVVIMAPWHWDFGQQLRKPLAQIEQGQAITPKAIMLAWAKLFEVMRSDNKGKLAWLHRAFWVACFLTGAQVVAWAIAATY